MSPILWMDSNPLKAVGYIVPWRPLQGKEKSKGGERNQWNKEKHNCVSCTIHLNAHVWASFLTSLDLLSWWFFTDSIPWDSSPLNSPPLGYFFCELFPTTKQANLSHWDLWQRNQRYSCFFVGERWVRMGEIWWGHYREIRTKHYKEI